MVRKAGRGWKRRWFMVRGTSLVYYKSAEHASLGEGEKERVEIFQATIRDNLGVKEGSSSQKFGFTLILSGGREFHLACENDREKQEWITYLEAVRSSAVGNGPRMESASPGLAQGWLLKKGGSKASATGGDEALEDDAGEVRDLFAAFDQDGDGSLSAKELKMLAREGLAAPVRTML